MVRRKMDAAGLPTQATIFATLAGEDLARLPAESLDAIVIASALHHVGDWRGFLGLGGTEAQITEEIER